jgi:Ankyrin repeats (3 copies)
MPTRVLQASTSFADIERRTRDLVRDRRLATLPACQRIREFHPQFEDASDEYIAQAPFTEADAKLTIAHEYGFESWANLKAFAQLPERPDVFEPAHLRIEDPLFRRAVDLLDAGDAAALRELLQRNPGLATQRLHLEGTNYFHDPTLLEFVAENPTRNGRLPANAPEMAQIVVDAGAKNDRRTLTDTLALVASSAVAQASGLQPALIRVLSSAGADPNDALLAPLIYGQFDAVEELLRNGATLNLPVAAATGRLREATDALATATELERQRALSLATQFGHADIVRLLVEAGTDPNRFSPPRMHSHGTPLHQAALNGDLTLTKYLVEHGARTDIIDVRHDATPLEWAQYAGHDIVAQYLTEVTR